MGDDVMNQLEKSVLEAFGHVISLNPGLAPVIEGMTLKAQNVSKFDSDFLLAINKDLLSKSKSQLRQDLVVLHELNFKRGGYFVEFGATNGRDLSNTHMLETYYAWNGILAEPARCWHDELVMNRKCHIETSCVWSSSGKTLEFNETKEAELSTINHYSDLDAHVHARKDGEKYDVNTLSLNDLLEKYNAPAVIDYLSIDTEGSEFEILSNFDFSKYSFKIVTVEHNYTSNRALLYDLLTAKGYVRVYENVSRFDDWYVLKD
jgi:FkbM family methyltransferase